MSELRHFGCKSIREQGGPWKEYSRTCVLEKEDRGQAPVRPMVVLKSRSTISSPSARRRLLCRKVVLLNIEGKNWGSMEGTNDSQ